jgi:hypothetical protein
VKLKIFTDAHEYGAHPMKLAWDYGMNSYSLGDNVDLSCCKPRDVIEATKRKIALQKLFSGRYVSGNHELDTRPINFLKVDDVLLTHGDYIFWRKGHADRYRKKMAGTGWFHFWYTKVVFGWLLSLVSWPVSYMAREKAWRFAKSYGCHTVVCGHWHPTKVLRIKYKDITLIVLPRGMTEIDV